MVSIVAQLHDESGLSPFDNVVAYAAAKATQAHTNSALRKSESSRQVEASSLTEWLVKLAVTHSPSTLKWLHCPQLEWPINLLFRGKTCWRMRSDIVIRRQMSVLVDLFSSFALPLQPLS